MTMFPKSRAVRLHGPALKKLVQAVYERDKGCCVCCGRYVEEGVKSHHEPPKSQGGQDIEENMVTLCNECHYKRHNTAEGRQIKDKCERLLRWLYEV